MAGTVGEIVRSGRTVSGVEARGDAEIALRERAPRIKLGP